VQHAATVEDEQGVTAASHAPVVGGRSFWPPCLKGSSADWDDSTTAVGVVDAAGKGASTMGPQAHSAHIMTRRYVLRAECWHALGDNPSGDAHLACCVSCLVVLLPLHVLHLTEVMLS
jgi:hypothetical protein